ncbi:MAG: UDP-glucose dehydrogenase family protein [Actinomycetota bacterium]
MAQISIVGCWHQGTVLSACFADLGHVVAGIPATQQSAAFLSKGRAPVREPGLDAIIRRNIKALRLRYTTSFEEAIPGSEFVFVSFDTPVGDDDRAQVGVVREAAESIARRIDRPITLVVTAQVPVGMSQELAETIERQSGKTCSVSYVPEFLRLGEAVNTFRKADRFVIGCEDDTVAEKVAALYRPLKRPLIFTGVRAAEMSKHASNSFLAVSIAFANELADICDEREVDFYEVMKVMKADPRIGQKAFLAPGLGFAGGTLGRDLRALQDLRSEAPKHSIIDDVVEANRNRPKVILRMLRDQLGDLPGKEIGILGLTYKPGTSTIRRSTALEVIGHLANDGVKVKAFDPLADLNEQAELPPFTMCEDVFEVADGADALVLITEWPELEQIDLSKLGRVMRGNTIIDTRNFFDNSEMARANLSHLAIGRGFKR